MKTRLITAAVLIAVLVPIFYFGGIALDITLLLFSMIATWELSRIFSKEMKNPKVILVLEVLFSGGLFYLISRYYQGLIVLEWAFFTLIALVIVGALLLVFYDQYSSNEFGNMFISVLYPALGFSAFNGIGAMDNGVLIIGFLFVVTSMTDTFAYIFGVRFGKHRLAEKISPKKSIEGSVAGTIFAVIIAMLYLWALNIEMIGNIEVNFVSGISLIFVISVVGQIGDLVASKLKRDCNVKDYSNLFPGHGGVMDRFDSAIFGVLVLMLISEVVGML